MHTLFPHKNPLSVGDCVYEAADIIKGLASQVSDRRKARIAHTVSNRTCQITPVMEGLYDRGNVSAVLRSAEAMGYQVVHNIDNSEHFMEARRVTQGAEKWLDISVWDRVEPCISTLKAQGYRIIATHLEEAKPIQDFDFDQPTAVVFGNEKEGVSPELVEMADECMIIPMAGFVQSFNISVAAALCLYHIQQDRLRRLGAHGDLSAEEQEILTAQFYLRSVPNAPSILNRVLEY